MTDTKKLPPGPGGIGFVSLLRRLQDTLGFYLLLRKRYGEIVCFRMFFMRFCIVFDADLIDQVLVKQAASFEKGPAFKAGFENPTSITSDGAAHKRLRKLIQPVFFRKALEGYAEKMIEQAVVLQQDWRNGDDADIEALMLSHSQNVIAKTFFGSDVEFDPNVIKEVLIALERSVILTNMPFGKLILRFTLPWLRRHNPYFKKLDETIKDIIRKAREKGQARGDLVSLLVHATDEEGIEQPLTDEEVRDEAYMQIMAGHETIATAMSWCFYHLSRNPAVREKMEQEIAEVLQGGPPTVADYAKLGYTRAVFDESLRLSSSLHMLGRRALEDCTIGGYHVPQGTVVQPLILAPRLDEKYYPQAGQFKPERWLETRAQDRTKRAYLPFGGGPRSCIGQNFARMEGVLTLATVCQRWRVELVSDEFPEVSTLVLYRLKHGMPVTLRKRPDAPSYQGLTG